MDNVEILWSSDALHEGHHLSFVASMTKNSSELAGSCAATLLGRDPDGDRRKTVRGAVVGNLLSTLADIGVDGSRVFVGEGVLRKNPRYLSCKKIRDYN